MTQEQLDICESLDWRVIEDADTVELGKYSPAGEDFSFTITDTDNIAGAVMEYALDFDIDEHIEMWICTRRSGASGIPPTRELVTDAEAIKDMLRELSDTLSAQE